MLLKFFDTSVLRLGGFVGCAWALCAMAIPFGFIVLIFCNGLFEDRSNEPWISLWLLAAVVPAASLTICFMMSALSLAAKHHTHANLRSGAVVVVWAIAAGALLQWNMVPREVRPTFDGPAPFDHPFVESTCFETYGWPFAFYGCDSSPAAEQGDIHRKTTFDMASLIVDTGMVIFILYCATALSLVHPGFSWIVTQKRVPLKVIED